MIHDDEQIGRILSRREALALLGGAAALFLPACASGTTSTPAGQASSTTGATTATTAAASSQTTVVGTATTVQVATPSCVVKPEVTEGPYFVDEKLNRSDIRPDPSGGATSEGSPLKLVFRVARVAAGCTALAGATVDVWQCDANGVYSDVAANRSVGKRFLRGYQTTDANGAATFTTIYPGWYMGRTVHIHFKIRTSQGQTFTSQLFFDEAVTDTVLAKAPYNSRGTRDTTNARDGIYKSQLLLPVTPDGSGYAGTFDIGLQI